MSDAWVLLAICGVVGIATALLLAIFAWDHLRRGRPLGLDEDE